MLQIYSKAIFKAYGQNIVQLPIANKVMPNADTFVANTSAISKQMPKDVLNPKYKDEASALVKKLGISLKEAYEILEKQGKHLIDVYA